LERWNPGGFGDPDQIPTVRICQRSGFLRNPAPHPSPPPPSHSRKQNHTARFVLLSYPFVVRVLGFCERLRASRGSRAICLRQRLATVRWAHADVSVTGATGRSDRFGGSAPTIDWWHSVSGTSLLAAVCYVAPRRALEAGPGALRSISKTTLLARKPLRSHGESPKPPATRNQVEVRGLGIFHSARPPGF
jgi:hypothetical protein